MSSSINQDLLPPTKRVQTQLSSKRWLVLLLFSNMAAVQNAIWISFSVVVKPAETYFSVGTPSINFLAALGPLVLMPVAFITGPLATSKGLRWSIVLGSVLTGLGAVARVLAIPLVAHAPNAAFGWIIAGHTLNAAAGPIIMSCPPQVSATWFPANERTTATAVAFGSQVFGIAFGWLGEPFLVKVASDIPKLIWLEAAMGVLLALTSLCCPREPVIAPTISAARDKMSFTQGCKVLLRRPSYLALATLWAVSAGVYAGWMTLLDVFLEPHLTPQQIGWIGFGGNFAGMFGGIFAGMAIDSLDASLRTGLIALYGLSTLTACGFLVSVYLIEVKFVFVMFFTTACGFFANAGAPVVLEMASEMTFPVAEETAASLVMVFFSAVQLLFILVGSYLPAEPMNWANVVTLGATTVLVFFLPNAQLRKDVDTKAATKGHTGANGAFDPLFS